MRNLLACLAILLIGVTNMAPGITTLVYNFSYGNKQNVDVRDSANPAEDYGGGGFMQMNSGISHYVGSLTDKGTMTVRVIGMLQSDGGQIVTISEAGEQIRRAPTATCIVYGNTHALCDPNKTVYTEEYTLLRFLGPNFVDRSELDKNNHWQISQDTPAQDVTADYRIDKNDNGAMQISEARKIRPANGGSLTTYIQAKIGYDFKKSIPTSVDEYVTQYYDNGVQGTTTTVYQTTLKLVSDTMSKT